MDIIGQQWGAIGRRLAVGFYGLMVPDYLLAW